MMKPKLEILLKGHLLNPFWASRQERRRVRGEATVSALGRYLDRYAEFAASLRPFPQTDEPAAEEKLFSIWLQGEDSAPDVVKACWRSVRWNCQQELVILDSESLFQWISLPDYVVDKWRCGRMRAAHFADICRLELLYRYGGVWLDATDYVPAPLPEWLWKCDFFVYMSGTTLKGWYSYVQNCFIRARKGDFLVGAWRDMLLEYWKHEDSVVDYFVHQLLFRKLLECNPEAAKRFETMPKIEQDSTHTVWFGRGNDAFDAGVWDSLTSVAMFQKTEYKSSMAQNPPEGSFAAHLVSMYGE